MIMCRDLTLDDVKDIDLSMKCSAFDVLAAVAVRAKKILEEHLSATETKVVKKTHDGEASTSTSLPPAAAVAAWGKEMLIEEHILGRDTKRSVKRSYDGEASASASTSPPKKKKRTTKRNSNVVNLRLNHRPPMPERLGMLIREMAQGKNLTPPTPTLVIQKRLFETDLTKGHNRLSIPIRLISDDFLTEAEKLHVRARDVNGKKNFMQVKMIEPSLATVTVDLRQWDMVKGNGGRTSSMYVINGKWYELAMRNELKVDMEVQLWCFRLDQELCFALVRPPMQMLSF